MQQFQTLLANRGYYTGKIDGIIGPMSLHATQAFIADEIAKRNWVQPTTEFVYIRTDQTFDNRFSDFVVRFNKGVADMVVPCSTTPGDYYVFNPLTVGGITGCAVACEQQVIGSHTFVTSPNWKSLWLGAPYFMQTGAIEIFRDGNRNRQIDRNIRTRGFYGINLHRAGWGSFVDTWSAGCMVVLDKAWFEMIKIFTAKQVINYTLIEVGNK
jgi:hypothetical protein